MQSFSSRAAMYPKDLKSFVAKTLGTTGFDFATFMPSIRRTEIGARCSIRQNGLFADLLCDVNE